MEWSKNWAETGRAGHSRAQTWKQIQRSRDSSNITTWNVFTGLPCHRHPHRENGTAPSDWFLSSDISWFYMESWSQCSSIRSTQFLHMQHHQEGRWWVWCIQVSNVWQKRPLSMASITLKRSLPEIGRHFHKLCQLYNLWTKKLLLVLCLS